MNTYPRSFSGIFSSANSVDKYEPASSSMLICATCNPFPNLAIDPYKLTLTVIFGIMEYFFSDILLSLEMLLLHL